MYVQLTYRFRRGRAKAMAPAAEKRLGFTLIEMMVVIAIIAVLVALTVGVVVKNRAIALVVKNAKEMQHLAVAVDNFQADYKVKYLPSRLLIRESGDFRGYGKLGDESYAYLKKVWPKLRFPVDINGDGKFDGDWLLEGDQCLVFLLGGIQAVQNGQLVCLGFSRDPANPWNRDPKVGFREPFYQFESNRLILANTMPARPSYSTCGPLFTYLDVYGKSDGQGHWVWGRPIAYYSSYGRRNGFNRYLYVTRGSDCGYIQGLAPWPYAESVSLNSIRYLNPDSFQIISAGPDGEFGLGTNVSGNTSTPYLWNALGMSIDPAGEDDRSNFAPSVMSAGP